MFFFKHLHISSFFFCSFLVRWTGQWKQESFVKGKGLILLGTIKEMRFHSVTSANDIVRYHVLILNVSNAHRREKDKSGLELNVN